MSERVREFMDDWFEVNVARRELPANVTMEGLRKRCVRDAKLAGISLEEIEEVVVDLEEAIGDEIKVKARAEKLGNRSTVMPDERKQEEPKAQRNRLSSRREVRRKETEGQFARTRKGAKNNGISSAEPRVISGDEAGDATFPLNQGKRR